VGIAGIGEDGVSFIQDTAEDLAKGAI